MFDSHRHPKGKKIRGVKIIKVEDINKTDTTTPNFGLVSFKSTICLDNQWIETPKIFKNKNKGYERPYKFHK